MNNICALSCVCIGSFHLIHLMFDDYVLYLLESLHCQERANELMRAMKGEGSTGESTSMLSDSYIWDKICELKQTTLSAEMSSLASLQQKTVKTWC